MQWISVHDQMPDDYQEVLYFASTDSGCKEIMTGHRDNEGWTHCCMFYSTMHLNNTVTVTHWMPLPDYPVSDKLL